MNNSKFLYNNEGLCMIGIMSILEIVKEMNYSKIMLIAPIIFNEKSRKFLASNSTVRSLEEFEIKQNIIVSKFNSMYYNYLPISINSLVILADMNFIELKSDKIKIKESLIEKIDKKKIGKRANQIIKISKKVINIINEPEEKIYMQLGVVL